MLLQDLMNVISVFQGEVFLVKWLGYHKNESTWEPISHLPEPMTGSYLCPPVDSIRLERAALDFESAIQKRLSSRSSSVILSLELDIYRHVFETDQSVLVESEDQLKKLPLCANWSYKLKANGKGVRVSFPLRVSPKLMNRVMFIRVDGDKLKKVTVPEERCIVVCAIEPFV